MKKNYQNIIIIIIFAFLIMLPTLLSGYHFGHDTTYHIANTISLKEQIENSRVLSILPNIAYNFGYGTRLFYPPLPHFLPALITIVTTDVLLSLKITHFIILLLSSITLYSLSLRLFKNKKIALISALIYTVYPYHLSDIFIRDALAECLLFFFIPLILLGLTYLFENKRLFYLFFVLGYVGGMLSHLTMLVYFTFLLIPFFIINYKKVFKKDIIIVLILSAVSILLITSPLLVTMLQHKFLGNYAVFLDQHMANYIWWAARNPLDYINIFKNFANSDIKYYMDFVTIILLVTTLYKYKEIDFKFKSSKFIIIFGITSIILSTYLFPWDLLPNMLRMIQFPWRIITYASIAISLIAPLCLQKYFKKTYLLIPLLFLSALFTINSVNKYDIELDKLNYNHGMGWQKEYLPLNTLMNQEYLANRKYEIVAEVESIIVNENFPNMEFVIKDKGIVELPRLYYLGYSLRNEKDEKITIRESDYGFIESDLEKGTYYLTYEGTIAYNWAKGLSLSMIIIYLLYFLGGMLWKKSV